MLSAGDDVFLAAPTPTKATKLSPTAEVFTPGLQTAFKLPAEVATPAPAQYNRLTENIRGDNVANLGVGPAGVGVRPLLNGSTAERATLTADKIPPFHGIIGAPAADPAHYGALSPDAQSPCLDRLSDRVFALGLEGLSRGRSHIQNVKLVEGAFSTDDHVFRAFIVDGVPRDLSSGAIAAAFSVCHPPSIFISSLTLQAIFVPICEVHQCCACYP